MPLEFATFISDLVPANPVGGVDYYSTADDHLRLLKSVLQSQFPNFNAVAVNVTPAELNALHSQAVDAADFAIIAGAAAAGVTSVEFRFLDGVTSAIQTQLDAKAAVAHNHNASDITVGQVAIANGGTGAATAGTARTNLGIGSIATRAWTASTGAPSGGADGDVWAQYV